MKFIVTYQNVWTTSGGQPYTATEASNLLGEFRNYWNYNMVGVTRDLAHLFTGKSLNGSIAGISYRPGLSGSGYGLSVFDCRSATSCITAHEIGHNLNAEHTVNPDCGCNTSNASIMCDGLTNTSNARFCTVSVSQISAYLRNHQNLLAANSHLTLTGTVNGFREYLATQKITSNQIINSGQILYKANEVELGNNFEVKPDAVFEIRISGCP